MRYIRRRPGSAIGPGRAGWMARVQIRQPAGRESRRVGELALPLLAVGVTG